MPKSKSKPTAKEDSAEVEEDAYTAGQLTQLLHLQSAAAPANQDATLASLFAPASQSEEEAATAGPLARKRKLMASTDAAKEQKTKQQPVVSADDAEADRAVTKARSQLAKQRQRARETDSRNCCTVFVGNVASAAKKRDLLLLFRQHGPIESVRFRSAAPADAGVVKRLAVIHKKLSRPSLNAYIVYKEPESVAKAVAALNGHRLCEMHLRVDRVDGGGREGRAVAPGDDKKCVFLGNLHFKCDEESVRAVFSQCGPLTNIRLVRDSRSGVGRGFGFVQFADPASVELALRLAGTEVVGRPVRVTRCSDTAAANASSAAAVATKRPKKMNKTSGREAGQQERMVMKQKHDNGNDKPPDRRPRHSSASRPTNRTFAQAFERRLDMRRAVAMKKTAAAAAAKFKSAR